MAFLRGRPLRQAARPRNGSAYYFPSRHFLSPIAQARWGPEGRPLYIANQNSRLPPSSASLRPPSFSLRGAGLGRSPPFVATKAAMGAVNPTKGNTP
jgi:hypothetical protein